MFAVAVAELAGDPEAEAVALAPRLGLAPYDLRVALRAVRPSVVLRTPSRAQADAALDALRARGHEALACDTTDVVPTARMVHVHRMAFDDDALVADSAEAGGPRVAWGDFTALIRVASSGDVERTTIEHVASVSAQRVPVRVEQERTRHERSLEHALYLFHGAEVPWVLRAHDARYLALGKELRPTALENFAQVIAIVRQRATRAVYDDRYVARPITRATTTRVRDYDAASPSASDPAVDLAVHLLARVLVRFGAAAYRD